MTIYLRCIATFPHDTGLPEDSAINTWAFTTADVYTRGTAAVTWSTAMNTFYESFNNLLSSAYNWTGGTYEFIDMADDKPRVPFATFTTNITGVGTTGYDLPAETSIVLSFRGDIASGQNAKRRRGRVYLGPLQYGGLDMATIGTGDVDDIAAAADALKDTAGVTWCVYSRYNHHAVPVGENIKDYPDEVEDALPSSFVPVTTVWVDNAWDNQRRRGTKATYRKTLT